MFKALLSILLMLSSIAIEPSTETVNLFKLSKPMNIVDDILWWFPENIETLTVARGPFQLVDNDPKSDLDLIKELQSLSPGPFLRIQQKKFYQEIMGQTILLTVEGSRKFRSPSDIGLMPYEGCHMIFFQQNFNSIANSIANMLKVQADQEQEIAGYRVTVFKEKWEANEWNIYVAMPKPGVLLCATDQNFMREVLNRMSEKRERRALPDHLPEWKYVDTNAAFWAIRHYDLTQASTDPTSPLSGVEAPANAPDVKAIGLVYSYSPNKEDVFKIRYLSANEDAVNIMKKFWQPGRYKLKPQVQSNEAGVVEIAFPRDGREDEFILLILLQAGIGHGIYF